MATDETRVLLASDLILKLPTPPSILANGSWKTGGEKTGRCFSGLSFEPISRNAAGFRVVAQASGSVWVQWKVVEFRSLALRVEVSD